jgi:hypothetical protein
MSHIDQYAHVAIGRHHRTIFMHIDALCEKNQQKEEATTIP